MGLSADQVAAVDAFIDQIKSSESYVYPFSDKGSKLLTDGRFKVTPKDCS